VLTEFLSDSICDRDGTDTRWRSAKLGARCEVRDKDGKGELLVRYASWDELDRILELIL
jgi:hypothetical protein